MRITTDHAASSYGIPVVLDDDGNPLDQGPGVRAVRRRLGLSVAQLGEAVGKSPRTIEGYEQSRHNVPASVLYVLAGLLERVGGGA